MTNDEREKLEFLRQSSESLHASLQELHAIAAEHTRQTEAADARFQRLRLAMLQGIRAFLNGLDEPEEGRVG